MIILKDFLLLMFLKHICIFKKIACTKYIQEESTEIEGVHIRIIDTPGFYDTTKDPQHILTEIAKVCTVVDHIAKMTICFICSINFVDGF